MNERARNLLLDARDAADDGRAFIGATSLDDFVEDRLLKYGVYHAIQIAGEALNVATEFIREEILVEYIPELRKVIGTRHVLVHGYAEINDETIWSIARDGLPMLIEQIDRLLAANPD